MRTRIASAFGLAAALVAAAGVAAWLATAPQGVRAEVAREVAEPGDPEAGRIVFYIAGCESCHMSPGQKDPLRLGGGMELKTPFGSFYPPNISPDPADGIGKWSAENFADGLMAGVTPQGEHLSSPNVRALGVSKPILNNRPRGRMPLAAFHKLSSEALSEAGEMNKRGEDARRMCRAGEGICDSGPDIRLGAANALDYLAADGCGKS